MSQAAVQELMLAMEDQDMGRDSTETSKKEYMGLDDWLEWGWRQGGNNEGKE